MMRSLTRSFGYRPGVAVIGDLIVGISDGNTNVDFFERFEQNKLIINRFRADSARVLKR
jgi:hypothetical protein